MKFEISSPGFTNGEALDKKYAKHDDNEVPVLHWRNPPRGTESFVLIVDDPDAPTKEPWVHWLVYNIPGDQTGLTEPLGRVEELLNGMRQGKNDCNEIGYDGPHPPEKERHRYFFRLYALDTTLPTPPGASRAELLLDMEGHILDKTDIMATYER